ncbi:MAG: TonB-dependent receptor [Bacteroidota bacterium]
MRNLITAFFLLLTCYLHAQNGFLRGQVIDETTGEPLFGATVVKQGTTIGAVTDFDGNFSISLPPGSHTIVFQSVGFVNIVIENVKIEPDKATVLDIVMKEDVQTLGAVVVTAEVVKSSDAGLLLVQKKSINTIDGISSSTFRRVGDNDLSMAMKRVTGVTVQGGKYVYVRGLGDRYTKTALNGMIVPGLDPDRNDVQIDIFPTGVLENVVVYKTFSPNLTGDFTGGLVDIQTKAFPDEKSTSISFGFGFNPDMHFNDRYLSYEGSSTDFLGFDDGQRSIPVEPGTIQQTRFDVSQEELIESTDSFDPLLGASRQTSFMNSNFSISHRNQIQGEKLNWGYNALLTYRNNVSFLQDFERNNFERIRIGENIDIARDFSSRGDLASNEVIWSGLISLAAKADNTTIGTNFLHIQNGVSSSLNRTINQSSLNNPNFIYNDILSYTQRSLTNGMLFGKHQFNKLRVEWTNSLIFSRQYEPDYRDTRIGDQERDGNFRLDNGGQMERFWRELNEVNESFKLDFIYDLNSKNKLKFGGLFNYRDREFDLFEFEYPRGTTNGIITSIDPNELLVSENYFDPNTSRGFFITEKTAESNQYEGIQTVFAGYLMNEMQITDKLKSIYGVRLEKAEIKYTGTVTEDDGSLLAVNDETTLDETNLLPSLNLIYSLTNDINIRASYNKTLARPSFKEKAEVFIDDPVSDLIFIGNVDTEQAEIDNYDLRGEYFFKSGEMVSLSFFYKNFKNHIALVAFENGPNQITPRNVGSAQAFGVEFEMRKRLGFISSRFQNFMIGTNLSLVQSRVDRRTVTVGVDGATGEEVSEYQSEVNYRNTEEGVEDTRDMSFQAPYAINAFLNYESFENGLSANLSYNVQGETLTYVSAAFVPEVYTRPFNSLNFKIGKKLGKEQNSSISLTIRNILDDEEELFYRLESNEETFSLRRPGTQYSVSYSFSF